MTYSLLRFSIEYENDVVSVRQRARQVSGLLGFDDLEQARIATAVSEIARNAFRYAGGGRVEFRVETDPQRPPLLVVSVADQGPGIVDLQAVLEGRAAPGPQHPMGITSARRLVDYFHIESAPGKGTHVVLTKRFPPSRLSISSREIGRVAKELAHSGSENVFDEIRHQNQELLRAMEELRARQEELLRLNRELEDTNRGVVALYAELDEKALHLRRSDELKSRFLSNMSHEFRTPLNSILALSRLLAQHLDGELSEEQAKQVAFIQKSAQDLSALVDDLLDLAKVEAGRITVVPSETEVESLFGGLRGMFRPLLVNPAVSLVFEDTAGLPKLFTDEGKVSQILRNFISNALKFTEQGTVRVSASVDPAAQAVTFRVADTGIGIAPEDQERIFEEFTQIENPIQHRVKGTGLGLPLSRRLSQLLGGRIEVQSAPGSGSLFSFILPVSYSPRVSLTAAMKKGVDPTRYPVLVIDDDAEALLLYEKYLRGTGFQLLHAGGAPEVRRMLADVTPVAVVLDVGQQGDTWELLMELKRGERTRVIPLYAAGTELDREKALALGADDYFVRPLERRPFLTRLRGLVDRQKAPKILVVDDDDVARYLMREVLSDTRYQVIEASGGVEGFRIARQELPHAVLLDLMMPDLSGFEVLERLKADPSTREIPVIIVTSKALESWEREKLAKDAIAVLSKESTSRQETVARTREALAAAELSARPRH